MGMNEGAAHADAEFPRRPDSPCASPAYAQAGYGPFRRPPRQHRDNRFSRARGAYLGGTAPRLKSKRLATAWFTTAADLHDLFRYGSLGRKQLAANRGRGSLASDPKPARGVSTSPQARAGPRHLDAVGDSARDDRIAAVEPPHSEGREGAGLACDEAMLADSSKSCPYLSVRRGQAGRLCRVPLASTLSVLARPAERRQNRKPAERPRRVLAMTARRGAFEAPPVSQRPAPAA